jgi:hypothetical protein
MITVPDPLSISQVTRHDDELDTLYRQLWGEHLHHGLWLTGRQSSKQAARQLLQLVVTEAGPVAAGRKPFYPQRLHDRKPFKGPFCPNQSHAAEPKVGSLKSTPVDRYHQ